MTNYYVSITIILVVTSIVTSKSLDCRTLQWAPWYRRKVFTAIINNAYCPTWTTRNSITKEPTKYTKLRLPEGQPFAFNCGVCFTPGSFQVNITAEMYPDVPLILKPIIPKKNHNKNEDLQHFKDDHTVCQISYGLTRPIVKGGTLTCRFNIGTKVFKEKITFSVQRATTEEVGEEEVIEVPINGFVRLQCPKDESQLIAMHIWHHTTNTSEEDKVPFVVPSLDHEITYKPTKTTEKISCSTYDLTNPTLVRITRYKLLLKETDDIKPGKWVVEEPEEAQPQKSSANIILIVACIVIVGTCLVAFVLAFLGLCRRSRRRSSTEEEQQEQTKEQNHLNLITSSVSPYSAKRLQHQYRHQ